MDWNNETITEVVRHHAPNPDQLEAITHIRQSTADLISAIVRYAPKCADQAAAIRKAREAMMSANAAIVLEGMV
jgi:hypothetical protein